MFSGSSVIDAVRKETHLIDVVDTTRRMLASRVQLSINYSVSAREDDPTGACVRSPNAALAHKQCRGRGGCFWALQLMRCHMRKVPFAACPLCINHMPAVPTGDISSNCEAMMRVLTRSFTPPSSRWSSPAAFPPSVWEGLPRALLAPCPDVAMRRHDGSWLVMEVAITSPAHVRLADAKVPAVRAAASPCGVLPDVACETLEGMRRACFCVTHRNLWRANVAGGVSVLMGALQCDGGVRAMKELRRVAALSPFHSSRLRAESTFPLNPSQSINEGSGKRREWQRGDESNLECLLSSFGGAFRLPGGQGKARKTEPARRYSTVE